MFHANPPRRTFRGTQRRKGVLILLVMLLWPVLAWAVPKPVHYQTVAEDTVWEGSRWTVPWAQTRVGGELMFFDSLGVWKDIRNGWTVTGSGTNRHWVSNGDVLKVDVHYNGTTTFTTTMNGVSTVMTHKPNRIILENQETGIVTVLTGLNFGTMGAPTVIGDTLRYSKFSGAVVYEIIKKNATVTHRITFNPTCSNLAITAFQGMSDPDSINLSVEVDYTFDGMANPTGTVYETQLKDFGNRYKLLMERQWMNWTDGADTSEAVAQNWITGKMRERVKMPKVAQIMAGNANAKIWHNDAVSIGAAGIEDNFIYADEADNNYGAATYLFWSTPASYRDIIRVKDVDGALGAGATISNAACSLYTGYSGGSYPLSVSAYRLFKNWGEGTGNDFGATAGSGESSWNDWSATANEWGKAGADSANDAGADNSGDGTAPDRKATAESTVSITANNTWFSWSISAALAQGWYDLTMNENGMVFVNATSSKYAYPNSTEHATTANRPRFSFTFTTGGAPAGGGSNAQIILVE